MGNRIRRGQVLLQSDGLFDPPSPPPTHRRQVRDGPNTPVGRGLHWVGRSVYIPRSG